MAKADVRRRHHGAPLADINVVPLVDVMLVLLVIFIVTAPLLTHVLKIDLPQASSNANTGGAVFIELTIAGDGRLFWNGEPVAWEALPQRFAAASSGQPQPELHLHADRHTPYEQVAQVMAVAAKAGLRRIGFISAPDGR